MTDLMPTVLTTCRLIEFQDARVDEVGGDFSPYLVVSGLKPYANMRVELLPRMYIVQPEYWAIEVVGCISKVALPAITPYEVVLPLDFRVGTKGIRIVGADNMVQHFEIVIETKSNPDDGGKHGMLYGPDRPRG